MLAFGLGIVNSLAALPALLNGNGLPPLPIGWAFLTFGESHLVFDGAYLIVEAR